MKNDRQTILLEIIEQQAVETQEQLLRLLAERGVKCTQADLHDAGRNTCSACTGI